MKVTKIEGLNHLVHQEGVCGGRPTIKGTRIEPWHIANFGTVKEILESWNYLTKEQVVEAVSFYKNNKEYRDFIKKDNEVDIDENDILG